MFLNIKKIQTKKQTYKLFTENRFVYDQGWVADSTPVIYRWHLPVFSGLENTPQVANTGKYWQNDFFFALKYSRNFKQDGLRVHHNTKWVGNGLKLNWGKFLECW